MLWKFSFIRTYWFGRCWPKTNIFHFIWNYWRNKGLLYKKKCRVICVTRFRISIFGNSFRYFSGCYLLLLCWWYILHSMTEIVWYRRHWFCFADGACRTRLQSGHSLFLSSFFVVVAFLIWHRMNAKIVLNSANAHSLSIGRRSAASEAQIVCIVWTGVHFSVTTEKKWDSCSRGHTNTHQFDWFKISFWLRKNTSPDH